MASQITNVFIPSALLLAASAAHHYSSTPPRIAQQSSNHLLRSESKHKATEQDDTVRGLPEGKTQAEKLHDNRRLSRVAMLAVASTKYAMWFLVLLEVSTRLLSVSPSSFLSQLLLPLLVPSSTLLSPLTTPTYVALIALFAGTLLRHLCFRALGRHFSFTHTTLAEHSLVSSGPYAYARHPSYTGEVLVRAGAAALLLRAGGYAAHSGALTLTQSIISISSFASGQNGLLVTGGGAWHALILTLTRLALAIHLSWNAFNVPYLLLRAPREDAALRARFGAQWDAYAAHVPYRFVPGLL